MVQIMRPLTRRGIIYLKEKWICYRATNIDVEKNSYNQFEHQHAC